MWTPQEFASEEDLTQSPLILLLIVASILQTPITYSPDSLPRLSNQDVLTLRAHGLPESIVLRAIGVTENGFDVSWSAQLHLRREGISDEVIEAMLRAKRLNTFESTTVQCTSQSGLVK